MQPSTTTKNVFHGFFIMIVTLGSILALYGANILLGNLNQDEGWYLYAAQMIHQGNIPFRDFAFTQGPVLPYVFATVYQVLEANPLFYGRIFNGILAMGTLLLTGCLAARWVPKEKQSTAFIFALILTGINVYQAYFFTVIKTYSLCAFFLMAGFLLYQRTTSKHAPVYAFGAGILLALAAGTRLSAGITLPICGLYLFFRRKSLGDGNWICFGIGGMLTLFSWAVPHYLMNPEGFRFGLLEYHSLREGGGLVLKAGFISRVVQGYFVASALLIMILLFRKKSVASPRPLPGFLPVALSVIGMTFIHLSAQFPYDDYQVIAYPALCALLATAWCLFPPFSFINGIKTLWALWFLCLGAAGASPVVQDWFVMGRDRIWWRMKPNPDIVVLQDTAKKLTQHAAPGETLITQDVYLAVQAGLKVPKGLEMGPFSYYPDFTKERAEALRVVNRDMLQEILSHTDAPLAALSGYSLSIACPDVTELSLEEQASLRDLLLSRFKRLYTIPDFGQGHTTLSVFVAKDQTTNSLTGQSGNDLIK